MEDRRDQRVIGELRARIGAVEGYGRRSCGALPFGIDALDRCLPGDGLALGALHEVIGAAADLAAVPAQFVAGVLARLEGPVLWCLRAGDLYGPALAEVGLHPDRVIYAQAGGDALVLPVMEEGLRHPGLRADRHRGSAHRPDRPAVTRTVGRRRTRRRFGLSRGNRNARTPRLLLLLAIGEPAGRGDFHGSPRGDADLDSFRRQHGGMGLAHSDDHVA